MRPHLLVSSTRLHAPNQAARFTENAVTAQHCRTVHLESHQTGSQHARLFQFCRFPRGGEEATTHTNHSPVPITTAPRVGAGHQWQTDGLLISVLNEQAAQGGDWRLPQANRVQGSCDLDDLRTSSRRGGLHPQEVQKEAGATSER